MSDSILIERAARRRALVARMRLDAVRSELAPDTVMRGGVVFPRVDRRGMPSMDFLDRQTTAIRAYDAVGGPTSRQDAVMRTWFAREHGHRVAC